MNSSPMRRPLASRLRGLAWLCFAALAISASAQSPAPSATQTNLSTDRLLIILDISSGMQKRSENMQRIVGQMLSTGLDGQLRRGDTIGMWSFNDSLHTGEFPLQRWSPQSTRQITSIAAQFAQNQRYGRQATLAPVMAQLTNVVADSDRITVVLVSDGSASPEGTPFDDRIAEAFKLNGDEQRRQAMPFVTILRAVKGEFVGFKVNTPPWPLEYPAFPPEPVVATPQPTNPPPAKIDSPKSRTPIVTNDPKSAIIETNRAIPPITNSPPVFESKPAFAEPVTNPPPPVATNQAAPVTNIAKEIPPPTNNVNASGLATNFPANQPAGRFPIIPFILGGIALAGLAVVCLALFQRSRRPTRVSLITRSMNKDRK